MTNIIRNSLLGGAAVLFVIGIYTALSSGPTSTPEPISTNVPVSTPIAVEPQASTTLGVGTEELAEAEVVVAHLELMGYEGNPKEFMKSEPHLYVFIGQVKEKTGQVQKSAGITTQYNVQVIRSIRKDVTGTLVLNQSGVGYIEQGKYVGKLAARDGDMGHIVSEKVKPSDIFLKPGGVYLFAALSTKGKEFTISAPPYDRELITADAGLSDATALSLARENARVQAYVTAARELGVLNPEWGE